MITDDPKWNPPGKGDWRGLHDHFPRALTPEYQLLLGPAMEDGEQWWFERYGLPARTLQPAFIHGRVFISAAPLVGSASDRVPPRVLLWLAVRLIPAFRRREAAARLALAERRWLAEAEQWFEVQRGEVEEANNALDSVALAELDDGELRDHLLAVRDNARAGYQQHFRLHGVDLMPTGFLLMRAIDWGLDAVEVASLLAGSSPASRGVGNQPRWRLVTGYDLDERCAAELPDRAAVAPTSVERDPSAEDGLRARVPAADRAEWDTLLADARATYGVRDDNGLLTGAWPVGLLRRAMLEVGARLVARGAMSDREHAVELTVDELTSALAGDLGAPSASAAATRHSDRRRLSAHPAPASLGPELNLPLDALSPAMGFVLRGLVTIRDLGVTPPGARPALRGVGIGSDSVVGRACLADEPASALARFEPGDIVVTRGTCPAWNSILAVAGGIVTEEGGPLSHAAVIARELDLPALIGTAEAMDRIPDGATIELDPVAGEVRVVAPV